MMNKFYFIIILILFLFPIKNEILSNDKDINLTNIFSYEYIFIHHPWNRLSQLIYKALKDLRSNNLIIIDFIHLSNPYLFLNNLSIYLKNCSDINTIIDINIPLLIKSNNNKCEIYNNNPNILIINKFLNDNINNYTNIKRIYSKINYNFISDIIFQQKDSLIIFYIKNKKSQQIFKRIKKDLKRKIKSKNISIVYTDITNNFSFKLFNILDGYESDLPCLRYLKFNNRKLFFTKKNNINLLSKNISYILDEFINNSISSKYFLHSYQNEELPKEKDYLNINRNCNLKKLIINLYYNDWCEYCLQLFIEVDDMLEDNKYLLKYFVLQKNLIGNNFMNDEEQNQLYFNFLPRLHINDIYKKKTYEYSGNYKKEDILNFVINKINLINDFYNKK